MWHLGEHFKKINIFQKMSFKTLSLKKPINNIPPYVTDLMKTVGLIFLGPNVSLNANGSLVTVAGC